MEPFLCHFMDEVVILSDGRVTTCCMDPLADNCFGNVYEDSFEKIAKRHAENIERVLENAYALPRCRICYDKIKAGGFKPGRYKVNFSKEERERFVEQNTPLHQLVIEPSSICNLKCRGCMQSRFRIPEYREAKYLDMRAVDAFLGEHARQIRLIRLYNYGESFVNKETLPFVKSVTDRSAQTQIVIATNGQLLRTEGMRRELVRSGVHSLHFSIHGSSQESCEPYMTDAFRFDFTMDLLRDLVRIRKEEGRSTPLLVWKYLLFEWNEAEQDVLRAVRIAREIGLDALSFVVPGFPSPSPIYKDSPDKLAALNRLFHES